MKYILPAVSSLLLFFSAQHLRAQSGPFAFGVQAGFNMSGAVEKTNYVVGETKDRFGFMVGVSASYQLSRSFYLQSGLSLTTKGIRHERAEVWIGSAEPPVTYSKTVTRQTYLQLPLKIGFQLNVDPEVALFVHVGPYVAYGIGGRDITKNRTVGADVPDEKISESTFGRRTTLTNGLAREDYGWCLGLGSSNRRRMSLGLECEFGLANIGRTTDQNSSSERTYKNMNMSFVLGYKF